ncbi:MAG: RluA family pseudouridine synthase [Nitrospirae bacterium]|nr:RluA family pseudouridine synthase [Nitrospirota bacterium]
MKKMKVTVGTESGPERLDSFISSECGLTRSSVQKLVKDGAVLVNSKPEKPGCRVRPGDIIDITIPDEPAGALIPENIPLDIVFEDEHIIVVNKPPGMVIYPAAGNSGGTLMNALVFKCGRLASAGAPLRPGVVHRLDKETSGLIIVAKTDEAYFNLIEQFKNKEVEKYYMALVYGTPKNRSGEFSAEIGRSSSDRKKMSTKTRKGKEALTLYEVVSAFKAASLVKVRIITGRTHQIRVHFSSSGHPVLGDKTYGTKTTLKFAAKTLRFDRQMLHSYSLKFRHPVTNEFLELTAPLPEDMEKAVEELKE